MKRFSSAAVYIAFFITFRQDNVFNAVFFAACGFDLMSVLSMDVIVVRYDT